MGGSGESKGKVQGWQAEGEREVKGKAGGGAGRGPTPASLHIHTPRTLNLGHSPDD